MDPLWVLLAHSALRERVEHLIQKTTVELPGCATTSVLAAPLLASLFNWQVHAGHASTLTRRMCPNSQSGVRSDIHAVYPTSMDIQRYGVGSSSLYWPSSAYNPRQGTIRVLVGLREKLSFDMFASSACRPSAKPGHYAASSAACHALAFFASGAAGEAEVTP